MCLLKSMRLHWLNICEARLGHDGIMQQMQENHSAYDFQRHALTHKAQKSNQAKLKSISIVDSA